MRTVTTTVLLPLLLTGLFACEEAPQDAAPRLDAITEGDLDVDLVDRAQVLENAGDYDMVEVGLPMDLVNAPAGFTLAIDGGELGTDAPPPDWGYENWLAGATAVVWADAVAGAIIAPPAIAIGIAVDGEVTQIAPNVWQATNAVPLEGETITTIFTVAWVGTGWLAEMKLADTRGNAGVWFNGFLSYDGNLGWWDFYQNGDLAGVVEWIDGGEEGAQFGIARTNGADAGSLLTYIMSPDLNAIYAYDAGNGQDSWVTVTPADNAGEVRLPDYNAGNPACWDTNFRNVECGL